jgi:hypothetical protein
MKKAIKKYGLNCFGLVVGSFGICAGAVRHMGYLIIIVGAMVFIFSLVGVFNKRFANIKPVKKGGINPFKGG